MQLYEKSTHFILELLQNADDNSYDCSNPTLNFTYTPGSLRVDSNEVGFSASNVEAICSIQESTKRSTGYIGEKGIGFKSLFKVADIVWISSRQYSFKFDKREPLGMITPTWASFPKPTIPKWTSFFLQLSVDYDEAELIQELLNFDITLLMFLKSIREINIKVTQSDGKQLTKKLLKTEENEQDDIVTVLQDGPTSSRYLICRHSAQGLPLEHKRMNASSSDMLLAFSIIKASQEPQLGLQNVYAFLPIRKCGFKVREPNQ